MEEITLHDIKKIKAEINHVWIRFRDLQKKTELKINCDIKMIVTLILDVYPITRKQWDPVVGAGPSGPPTDDDPVERIYDDNITMLKNGSYTWWRYDEKHGSYSIYDANNKFYWIKKLEDGTCFIQSDGDVNILKRFAWAANSKGPIIYAKWNCSYCTDKPEYPPHILLCTKCYNPRYWACSDLSCQTPQALEDAKYCRKCGIKKYIK
jgi:hypothetical protein